MSRSCTCGPSSTKCPPCTFPRISWRARRRLSFSSSSRSPRRSSSSSTRGSASWKEFTTWQRTTWQCFWFMLESSSIFLSMVSCRFSEASTRTFRLAWTRTLLTPWTASRRASTSGTRPLGGRGHRNRTLEPCRCMARIGRFCTTPMRRSSTCSRIFWDWITSRPSWRGRGDPTRTASATSSSGTRLRPSTSNWRRCLDKRIAEPLTRTALGQSSTSTLWPPR